MYCEKCGFEITDSTLVECPFCHHKLGEKEKINFVNNPVNEPKNEDVVTNFKQDNVPNNNNYSYYKAPKETTNGIRNSLGYVNLNTTFWHHLLIAFGAYFLVEVGTTILSLILLFIFKIDTACFLNNSCPIETVESYNLITSISSLIFELLAVVIIIIIFRKYLKVFFGQFKEKQTWKWLGLSLAIIIGILFAYQYFLSQTPLSPTSSNQDGVDTIIYSTPILGFLFVAICAPLFEELVFRFGIFRSFTGKGKKLEIVGLIVTTALFASMHMIATFTKVFSDIANPDWNTLLSDMLSLPIYLAGSFGLTFAYYKSKNLATNILAHMIYNTYSFILIIVASYFVQQTQIIHFITRLLF